MHQMGQTSATEYELETFCLKKENHELDDQRSLAYYNIPDQAILEMAVKKKKR